MSLQLCHLLWETREIWEDLRTVVQNRLHWLQNTHLSCHLQGYLQIQLDRRAEDQRSQCQVLKDQIFKDMFHFKSDRSRLNQRTLLG